LFAGSIFLAPPSNTDIALHDESSDISVLHFLKFMKSFELDLVKHPKTPVMKYIEITRQLRIIQCALLPPSQKSNIKINAIITSPLIGKISDIVRQITTSFQGKTMALSQLEAVIEEIYESEYKPDYQDALNSIKTKLWPSREQVIAKLENYPELHNLISLNPLHYTNDTSYDKRGFSITYEEQPGGGIFFKLSDTRGMVRGAEIYIDEILHEAQILTILNHNSELNNAIPQLLAVGFDFNQRAAQSYMKLKMMRNWKEFAKSEYCNGLSSFEKIESLIRIAKILHKIHQAGCTHNDVHLGSMIINDQGEIMLSNFKYASIIGSKLQNINHTDNPDIVRTAISDIYDFGLCLEKLFPCGLTTGAVIDKADLDNSGLNLLILNTQRHTHEGSIPSSMEEVAQRLEAIKKYFEEKAGNNISRVPFFLTDKAINTSQ
jgi:hypothetical protein